MLLTRRHLLTTLPITSAAALGWGFHRILSSMKTGAFDPRAIQTPNTHIPSFSHLTPLLSCVDGFDSTLLQQQTRPILLNFWASWCIPCVMEMSYLNTLSTSLNIWGIVYKDYPEHARTFLKHNGQPYQRLGQDRDGRLAINWGVTGVPESFLIVPGGKCIWHHRADINSNVLTHDLMPLLEKKK